MHDNGITLDAYAVALYDRERIFDMWKVSVKKGWFGGAKIEGDLDGAWGFLESHASKYGLPLIRGDFDRTNRSPAWEQAIARAPNARAVFRRAYATTCAQNARGGIGGGNPAQFEHDEELMSNPFVPLAQRKPGLIERLENQHTARLLNALEQVQQQAQQRTTDPDPVIFPGQRLPRLSDLVRIQRAAQTGDLFGELTRSGVDPATYAHIMTQWAQIAGNDPQLQIKYANMLAGGTATAVRMS